MWTDPQIIYWPTLNRCSVIIVIDSVLDDRHSIPGRGGDFSYCHHIQIGCGTFPSSCPLVFGGLCTPNHSSPSSSEAKNAWSFTLTPPYVSRCGDEALGLFYLFLVHLTSIQKCVNWHCFIRFQFVSFRYCSGRLIILDVNVSLVNYKSVYSVGH